MKADRRFALTRCWSGGDSNCRSHPTKSLVSRRIGTDLLQPQTLSCEVRPLAVRSASLVERRGFEPAVSFVSFTPGRPFKIGSFDNHHIQINQLCV